MLWKSKSKSSRLHIPLNLKKIGLALYANSFFPYYVLKDNNNNKSEQ